MNEHEYGCFKVTFRTQQQCINIGMLLWQHVSVILDYLQANVPRYEVQSVSYLWKLAWRWSNITETWQHVSVILDRLQANVPRYEVQSVSCLWKLAWRWSNITETRFHNKIRIFVHCCVLTVNLKHFVSSLECKHNGMSSINMNKNTYYKDR